MATTSSSSFATSLLRHQPPTPSRAAAITNHCHVITLSFPVTTVRRSGNRLSSIIETTPSSALQLKLSCSLESRATVNRNSWEKLVLKSAKPVMVEFYASWCGPCRMVHRVIDEIAKEYSGKLNCFVLNTDSDLDIAEHYEIKAVPVVLLFKNGEKQETVVGTMPKDFYIAAIERVLQSS